jgi:hypothetical protein
MPCMRALRICKNSCDALRHDLGTCCAQYRITAWARNNLGTNHQGNKGPTRCSEQNHTRGPEHCFELPNNEPYSSGQEKKRKQGAKNLFS